MSIDQQIYQEVNYQFFLKRIHRLFFEILHAARESEGSKTDRTNLNSFFERKILVMGKMPKISLKTGFLDFCQKINPSMFLFFIRKWILKEFCDFPKSTCLKKNLVLKCNIFLSSISLERIK